MADDMKISAVKVGPFISGRATAVKPETAQERHQRHWIWIAALLVLVTAAAPIAGVILILGAAVVLAALTAPPADKGSQP